MAGFGRGNISKRAGVAGAVRKEDKAIANRPLGWSAGEARRAHRNGNAVAVRALKAGRR